MVHSILLNHLSIAEQAFLVMDFDLDGDMSPLPQYLPKTARNLKNLSQITTVNLHFDKTMKFVTGWTKQHPLYIWSPERLGQSNLPT